MPSDKVTAQPFVLKVLNGHLKEGRLASTYLFTGRPGSGESETALAFAAALVCLENRRFDDCACPACQKVNRRVHPDVVWVGDEEKRSIKIEEIRAVLNQAALRPYEGRKKVFIIPEADRLTPESSNALLKSLEEPSETTVFILLAENKAHLLETIQSRCFEIRFRPLSRQLFEGLNLESKFWDMLKQGDWSALVGGQQEGSREEILEELEGLLARFYLELEARAAQGADLRPLLKAIDLLIETKDAVESNVNSKLAMTRLTAQFWKHKVLASP